VNAAVVDGVSAEDEHGRILAEAPPFRYR